MFRNLISEIKKKRRTRIQASLCVCVRFSLISLLALDSRVRAIVLRVVKCFCCFYSLCWFLWERAENDKEAIHYRPDKVTIALVYVHAMLQTSVNALQTRISFGFDSEKNAKRISSGCLDWITYKKQEPRQAAFASGYNVLLLAEHRVRVARAFHNIRMEFGIYAFLQQWIFTGIFASSLHCLDAHLYTYSVCRLLFHLYIYFSKM